jgi:tetrapyrrole methylase family protein/MazG family protein
MNSKSIDRLLALMERLRGPGGCPWDREQSLASLKPYLIEECYEVIDAIDAGDPVRHAEELGDLLLQIVFQAQIRKERKQFTFDDVVAHIAAKLVRRHPHVFAGLKVSGSGEVLKNWEALKRREKSGEPRSAVAGVPRHLPALQKAHQVQARAARVGFDWTRAADVVAKIEEELDEVRRALEAKDAEDVRREIGDLLFAVVNLSRFQKLNAEELLASTVDKFIRRFQAVEQRVHARGRKLTDCSLAELDALWEKVKKAEKRKARQVPGQQTLRTRP